MERVEGSGTMGQMIVACHLLCCVHRDSRAPNGGCSGRPRSSGARARDLRQSTSGSRSAGSRSSRASAAGRRGGGDCSSLIWQASSTGGK